MTTDTTPPSLTALGLPATIDVADSPTISFTASAQDAASGVDRVVLTLDHDFRSGGAAASYLRFEDGTDSFADGVSSARVEFDSTTAAGTYGIASAEVYDKAGNLATYSAADLRNAGIATSFTVTNSAPDTTAPVLSGFAMPRVLDVSHGDSGYTIELSAEDASGLASISVALDHSIGLVYTTFTPHVGEVRHTEPLTTLYARPLADIRYPTDIFFTRSGSTYSFSLQASDTSPDGYHSVTSLTLTDQAGNMVTYSAAQLAASGYNLTTDVVTDMAPPVATALTLPGGVIDPAGPTLTFVLGATDGGTGVDHAILTLDHGLAVAGGGVVDTLTFNDPANRSFGSGDDFTDGSSATSLAVAPAAAGRYAITMLRLFDAVGNEADYSHDQLVAAGLPADFGLGWATPGDFSFDGRADLLWRNANGDISTWTSTSAGNSDSFRQNSFYAAVGRDWHVVQPFDMDGDGRSDILWRNTDGAVSVWQGVAAGGFARGTYNDGSVGNDWQIVATGDFNGDGRDDLLWRNNGGAIST